jgi:hypothetical protein
MLFQDRSGSEGANQLAADEVGERRASSPRNCSKTLRPRHPRLQGPLPPASKAGNWNACSKSARRSRARAADRPRHQPFAGPPSDPKLRFVGPDRRCLRHSSSRVSRNSYGFAFGQGRFRFSSWLEIVCSRHRLRLGSLPFLYRARPAEDRGNGLKQYLHIQPHRPLIDIANVESHPFIEADGASSHHLP